MSERVETWRDLAIDLRQRAKNALEHGEERVTSCEAIGNLLESIADRVRAVGERMEGAQHHADAFKYLCERGPRVFGVDCAKPEKRWGQMTLDEAIEHADEVRKRLGDSPCGMDHLQLAEWLRDLRRYQNGDYGVIMAALNHVDLFLWNIEKHAHSVTVPGDKCIACEGVLEMRDEIERARRANGCVGDKFLADLREMRNEVRAELREFTKPDENAPDPLAERLAILVLAPMLMGVRFGITACILTIKDRMKHPDGELSVFDRMSRRMWKKAGGAE